MALPDFIKPCEVKDWIHLMMVMNFKYSPVGGQGLDALTDSYELNKWIHLNT